MSVSVSFLRIPDLSAEAKLGDKQNPINGMKQEELKVILAFFENKYY